MIARRQGAIAPVVVVGAGIAGCSLTYELATRKIPVVLLEGGRIGEQGASAVRAALLNPYRGRSGRPGPLDLAGLERFWRLIDSLEALGFESGAKRSGVIRLASDERQLRSWRKRPGMTELGEVPAPYRAPVAAFLIAGGGWAEPHTLLRSLTGAAIEQGATVREHTRVAALERAAGEWRIVTADGRLTAPTVVLALGAGTIDEVNLPSLQRIAGDQVTLAAPLDLPYPVAGSVYFAADGKRVFVGGNHRQPECADRQAPTLLRSAAARVVPELAPAPIEAVWSGVRAKTADNRPLCRELADGLWFLGGFGGRGFLTAPLLAERLANRLAGDLGSPASTPR